MSIKNEYLGKHCRDKVTGAEGICTSVIEWLYGCTMIGITSSVTEQSRFPKYEPFVQSRIEILDEGVSNDFNVEFDEPDYFGKICEDKVHKNVVGICIARILMLGASEQYGIEIQPDDLAKESHIIWIDAGRIRLSENQEDAVDPSEVAGDKTGGVFPSGCYPDSSTLL